MMWTMMPVLTIIFTGLVTLYLVHALPHLQGWIFTLIITILTIMATMMMIMTIRSPAQDIPDIYWEQAARELDFCTCRKCQVSHHHTVDGDDDNEDEDEDELPVCQHVDDDG